MVTVSFEVLFGFLSGLIGTIFWLAGLSFSSNQLKKDIKVLWNRLSSLERDHREELDELRSDHRTEMSELRGAISEVMRCLARIEGKLQIKKES